MRLLTFSCLCFLLKVNYAAKILIFNPIFGFSHVKFVSKLADIIADHGQEVTLFQPFHLALKNLDGIVKNKNIEIINYYPDHYDDLLKLETQTFPDFWDSQLMNNPVLMAFMLPRILGGEFKKTTIQLIKDKEILKKLKDKKFDVAISETFELTGMYMSHFLGVPCIPILSAVRLDIFNEAFGQSSAFGYLTQQGSKLAPDAGFLDRLNDVYRDFFSKMAFRGMAQYQNDVIEKAAGHVVPYWKDLVKEAPVYMTNSNPYLDFAVPTTATIVHIGGITINLEKMNHVDALPEEYEIILKEKETTVLISFGSVIRSYEMPENFKAGLIKVFESLPDVIFIWKYEIDDLEFQKKLPKNVHLKKWVPQPSLLADKRVKLFVTHGGLGSTMEVAYTGKPALMVPIFGDQPMNADMLARHGGAIAYDKFDLVDGKKLTETVRDLVTNPKYEQKAKELLDVLTNQPIDPVMNLMKHLEFAIKFPNLRSQIPEINQVGPIAHYYLDVIVFLIFVSIITAYISFQIVCRILSRILSKKVKSD
ncbi:glucuronosyltransferase [Caenorhabditis elegans]|uniref:glucuronosyltransferase n=1 Tax=Caenorhabditis elegans TaxID=6239 RepID=O01616_CAEEL|nr:glucuronosyltransferase [Caenorhabditis elegans]CCD67006.1 glucuronosyltransferase [Caenorhabditis elegans]|eukprot:NP_504311.1 UDP-GlucuronosylTransferase [Caenorhabditis elegans]